jgi:hypothetical protein
MSRDVGSGDGGTVVSQRHGQVYNVPKQLVPPQVKARSSEIHRPSTRSLSGTGRFAIYQRRWYHHKRRLDPVCVADVYRNQ